MKIAFGTMVNDKERMQMILQCSAIGNVSCYTVDNPKYATKGLNILLDVIDKKKADIAILTHIDMFYSDGWLQRVKDQIALLPENWIIAGIVGKDQEGKLCGNFHDMTTPVQIRSGHNFPARCSCIDECTIIVNMKSGFRFDEALKGWDLYGTYACLKANEMGSAWIIDAWAEHYCGRFGWKINDRFKTSWKWLHDNFPDVWLDSTIVGKRVNGAEYKTWINSLNK